MDLSNTPTVQIQQANMFSKFLNNDFWSQKYALIAIVVGLIIGSILIGLVIFCQIKTQCVGKDPIKSLEDRDRHCAVRQGMVYRSKIAIVRYPRKTGSTFINF